MLKNTKTRTLVREILDKSNSPLTPAEIFEKLKTLDVTLSSIYRTLDAFTKEDIVEIKDIDIRINIGDVLGTII